jgi:rhodanese-related sulfurtransferase
MKRHGMIAVGLVLLANGALRAEDGAIPAREAWSEASAGRLVIIDVRSPDEWAATGTPRGALRISIEQSFGDDDFVGAVLSQLGHDRAVAVALICTGGERSRRAGELLAAAAFADVRQVREGLRGAGPGQLGWIELGLPLDR